MSDEIVFKINSEMPTSEEGGDADDFDINGVFDASGPAMYPATTYEERNAIEEEDGKINILIKKKLGDVITFGIRAGSSIQGVVETFTKVVNGTVSGVPLGTTLLTFADASFDLFSAGTSFYGDLHLTTETDPLTWLSTPIGIANDLSGMSIVFDETNETLKFHKSTGAWGTENTAGVQIDFPLNTDALKNIAKCEYLTISYASTLNPLSMTMRIDVYRTDLNTDGSEGHWGVVGWQPDGLGGRQRDIKNNEVTGTDYTQEEINTLADLGVLRCNISVDAGANSNEAYREINSFTWSETI